MMLPPKEGTCEECAVNHDPIMPHNRDSLCYQYAFYAQHNRWPTWADAMAHCPQSIKDHWTSELNNRGIDVNA